RQVMERSDRHPLGWYLSLLLALPAGCSVIDGPPPCPLASVALNGETARHVDSVAAGAGHPASFMTALQPAGSARPPKPEENPFLGLGELSLEVFVEQVLARNPTLAQMNAAWQTATARYPQVTSLDDPMFGATVGPASIGSTDVDFAYRLEAS